MEMLRRVLILLLLAISMAAVPAAGDCPSMCGDTPIPYPFGVGPNCSLPGFAVTCNETTSPHKLYTGNIEIANITLETAEMLVYAMTTYICTFPGQQADTHNNYVFNLSGSPFLLSPDANMFTAIGCSALAKVTGISDTSYLTGCLTNCASVDKAGRDGEPCRALGCCEAAITPGLSEYAVYWNSDSGNTVNPVRAYNPCQFAFIAQTGWYNFSRTDLTVGSLTSAQNFGLNGKVPLILDWAVRNDSCPTKRITAADGPPFGACVSNHSECISASNGQKGYFCNCSLGYKGNPYEEGGCKNIDECERRNSCKKVGHVMILMAAMNVNAILDEEVTVKVTRAANQYCH